MRILVTGGCGYKGTVLVDNLLKNGHEVTAIDTQWFGNYLKENKNLKIIKSDIRNTDQIPVKGHNTIIHLANIANDPAVELNPTLSWEINVLAGQQLIEKARREEVSQFIFASSGSVYGVKDDPKVTEDLELLPISVYNKTKMVAERVFMSYREYMKIHCIRPATVCGFSPRMRLDVSVNMFAFQALKNREITVFGGDQVRPNVHIKDMVAIYNHFINKPEINSGCYNAGFENISIREIAEMTAEIIPSKISITKSNDPRSYRQDSTKLLNTGFKPKFGVKDAIKEISAIYKNGSLPSEDNCYTVKWMKKLNLK